MNETVEASPLGLVVCTAFCYLPYRVESLFSQHLQFSLKPLEFWIVMMEGFMICSYIAVCLLYWFLSFCLLYWFVSLLVICNIWWCVSKTSSSIFTACLDSHLCWSLCVSKQKLLTVVSVFLSQSDSVLFIYTCFKHVFKHAISV